jgi:glycosyltransferase involved in cell wall biosynthesis
MTAPRVLALLGDETGCSLWRVWSPFAEMQRHGVFAHWKLKDDPETIAPDFVAKVPLNFDAVLLPRLAWTPVEVGQKWIDTLHRVGLCVIYECDDDVWSPSIVQRQYAVHATERAKGLEQLELDRQARIAAVGMCDGVTVTNRRLATIVRQYTDAPVEVVPNAIDVRWFRGTLRGCRRVVPPLTIGFAGGARYPDDLIPVGEAWARIARRYPEVRFVTQGYAPEALVGDLPSDRVTCLPWLPLEEYPRAMLNIDIGCASVAPRPFNTAKTPIKVWEYTLAGATVVASPTLYGPYVADGEDGLLAETADEWEAALSRLIEDAALRRRLWRAQRRRVAREHSLEVNWWRWPEAWSRIIETYRSQPAASPLVLPTGSGSGMTTAPRASPTGSSVTDWTCAGCWQAQPAEAHAYVVGTPESADPPQYCDPCWDALERQADAVRARLEAIAKEWA